MVVTVKPLNNSDRIYLSNLSILKVRIISKTVKANPRAGDILRNKLILNPLRSDTRKLEVLDSAWSHRVNIHNKEKRKAKKKAKQDHLSKNF